MQVKLPSNRTKQTILKMKLTISYCPYSSWLVVVFAVVAVVAELVVLAQVAAQELPHAVL